MLYFSSTKNSQKSTQLQAILCKNFTIKVTFLYNKKVPLLFILLKWLLQMIRIKFQQFLNFKIEAVQTFQKHPQKGNPTDTSTQEPIVSLNNEQTYRNERIIFLERSKYDYLMINKKKVGITTLHQPEKK
jgi:hypothetical protein